MTIEELIKAQNQERQQDCVKYGTGKDITKVGEVCLYSHLYPSLKCPKQGEEVSIGGFQMKKCEEQKE